MKFLRWWSSPITDPTWCVLLRLGFLSSVLGTMGRVLS